MKLYWIPATISWKMKKQTDILKPLQKYDMYNQRENPLQ